MKISIKIMCLFALIAISCNSKSKYDLFADDLCVCMKPMADLQKEMMDLSASGNQEAMMALFEKASKVDSDGQACMLELEKKHGRIEGKEEEDKAMEALRKSCPDIVALMEQSAPSEMPPMEEMEAEDADGHEGHDH